MPLIVFSLLGLLWLAPFPGALPPWVNWAGVFVVVSLVYYAWLAPRAKVETNVIGLRNPATESVETFLDLVRADRVTPWYLDMLAPDIETASDDYARRFSGEVGAYFLDVQARTTLSLLEPWPGARVLDVGGGHGQVAIPLAENGFDVTVTGSSDECKVVADGDAVTGLQ